ncbi:TetR/AcrR family transcriptional regulator [Paenibacillus sp. NAIST15-1]|uniref:TetR/AcrR family transcriptional regulator n=1 Tax=Paenibacillus sp. NAIST15-1 TaxID=1605994 RepID=UPI00086D048D|nr:TetR/AcrR family transcriptional regulator [Paenibacillus sp. NAIST15-1]GAV15871.1 transcriptional regulator [Paenibacillus sp. NAIST15-1]
MTRVEEQEQSERMDRREPKQKRSIEKKNKIIQAGYELFSQKGYHKTNTAEIAKLAGVSTGIVYNYFVDKKDIFMEVLSSYTHELAAGLQNELTRLKDKNDLMDIVYGILEVCVKSHSVDLATHEEFLAISHMDEEVRDFYECFENEMIVLIDDFLRSRGIAIEHSHEKMKIAYSLIESVSHAIVREQYEKRARMNCDVMKREAVRMIVYMLSNETAIDAHR